MYCNVGSAAQLNLFLVKSWPMRRFESSAPKLPAVAEKQDAAGSSRRDNAEDKQHGTAEDRCSLALEEAEEAISSVECLGGVRRRRKSGGSAEARREKGSHGEDEADIQFSDWRVHPRLTPRKDMPLQVQ